MRYRFFLFFLFCFLLACQGGEEAVLSLSSRTDSFSDEEKRALFPNKLFLALVDQRDEKFLKAIIDKNGEFLLDTNKNGDTALGAAIQFYNLEGALFIAENLSPEHYLHQNNKGESYLYMASKRGYVKLIQFLSNQFYNSRSGLLSDYEFSDLDSQTVSGERALHVAKSYMVAEALEHEYWRGVFETPFRKFQYLQNEKGQTFLHTAVRDQNSDLLRWGVEQACDSKTEWKTKAWYGKTSTWLWRGLQDFVKPFGLNWDDRINTQDEEGFTAVNFSVKNRFYEGVHILSDCQWTDWLLQDHQGNIPLQNFLLALDSLKISHDSSVREMFSFLIERRTRLTLASLVHSINSINKEGESVLHISARMANPYFYNQLKQYGDIEQVNAKGESPREIFERTRKHFN